MPTVKCDNCETTSETTPTMATIIMDSSDGNPSFGEVTCSYCDSDDPSDLEVV